MSTFVQSAVCGSGLVHAIMGAERSANRLENLLSLEIILHDIAGRAQEVLGRGPWE